MQGHADRPIAGKTTGREYDDLLFHRMSMLGLDPAVIERGDSAAFKELKTRCVTCDVRDACVVDLKRDPNNPVWESYCPNSAMLNGLTEAWWLPH